MWLYTFVPVHLVVTDIPMRLLGCHVISIRYPFRFQAPEQSFHQRVIPAIPAAAYTLLDPVPPQPLTELTACVLTTLIRVEPHILWAATLLKGHPQRLPH